MFRWGVVGAVLCGVVLGVVELGVVTDVAENWPKKADYRVWLERMRFF